MSFSALQHIQNEAPFSSLSLRMASDNFCPCCRKSHIQGLATLFAVSAHLHSLELFFQFQRSWASLYEAFLLFCDLASLSTPLFRSCVFLHNLPAMHRRFNGFCPQKKPCPCLPPNGLDWVRASCSHESFDLSGVLFLPPSHEVSLF